MNSVRASLASQTSVVPVVTRRSLNKSNVSQTSVVPVVPVVIGQSLNSNVNQSRVVVAVRTNAQREWPVEEILVELNGSTNLLQEVVETWQKSKECRNPNQCERIMEELYEKDAESAAPNGTGLAKPKCWQVLIWGIRYRQILEELNTEEKKLYSRHFQADATTSGIPLIVYQHTTIFPALFTMNCALENEVHRIFSYIASKSELWLVSNLNHLNIALEQVLKQKQVQSQEQKRTLRPGAIRLPFYQINLGGKPDLALIKRFDHRNPQVLQRSMCVRCGYPFSGKNELACVRCNLHKTTSLSQKSDELKKSLGNLNTTLLEFIQKDGFVYCCHVPASTGKNVVSDRNDFLALSIDQVRKTYRNDWKGFKERLEKLGKPFKSNEIYVFLVYVNLMRTSAKDLYSSCSPLVQRGLTKLEFFLVHAHIGGILVSIRNQMPNAIANFAHFEQQWFKGNPNEAEACAQIEKDLKSFSKWWKISTRVDSEVSKLLDTLLTQSFDLPFVKQDFAFIYHLLKDEFNSVNIDRVSRQGNDQTKAVDSPFKMQCAPISECEFLKKSALVKQIQDKNYTEDSCRCFPWMITEKKQARKGNQKTESATASATAFADLGAEVGAIASATASADVDVGAIASATARFDFNFDEEPTVL